MSEQYEDDLRKEADVLERLVKLFVASEDLLGKFITEGEDCIDPDLLTCLRWVQYVLAHGLEHGFELEDGKTVRGLMPQFENVLDEIQTLQAGLKTRDGIEDED